MMGDYQYFGGKAYRFNPAIKRYKRGKNGREQLHRVVYSSEYGNIPHGWVVHHIDNDPHNNILENLQAMSKRDHDRHHRPALSAALSHSNRVNPHRLGRPNKSKE